MKNVLLLLAIILITLNSCTPESIVKKTDIEEQSTIGEGSSNVGENDDD